MITIRMSQSGYCPKRLSAMLLGREGEAAPPWLGPAASEGNWHEDRLKRELTALGCEVRSPQMELSMQGEGYKAVGHIDGVLKITPRLFDSPLFTFHYLDCSKSDIDFDSFHLLEVKSFSFLEHQRWLAEGFEGYFRHYACQHTFYRSALNETISFFATKDRSGGARNLYIMGADPVPLGEVASSLALAAKAAEQGDLAPAVFSPDSLECRRCNYRTSQCLGVLPPVDDADVIAATRDYQDGREQEREGKLLAEQAKGILIAYAKRKGIKRWSVQDKVVSYACFPREDISIRRLLEIMPRQQFEPAVTVSEVERIMVTTPNKEG